MGAVLAPEAVLRECLSDPSRPGAEAIRQALKDGVLRRFRSAKSPPPERMLELLGAGESAAIATARALRLPVLLDDKAARRIARRLSVQVIGTGGVLLRAKRSRRIPAAGPLLAELRQAGYRLSDALIAEILRRARERR